MDSLNVQGRSGSVAFPRVNVVLARAARFVVDGAADRMAVRRALWRRSVLDMMELCVWGMIEERRGSMIYDVLRRQNIEELHCGRSFDKHDVTVALRTADIADLPRVCTYLCITNGT